jgi:RNA polymerase sigma-70 factor (ECF subfamily)
LGRAKNQLKTDSPPEEKSIPAGYLDKYLHVIRNGDIAQLEKLLTDDITVISDGGGKVAAFMKPVVGRKPVMALLQGIYKKFYSNIHIEQRWINHQPALFYYEAGKLVNCQVFSFRNGYVDHIFFMRNPDKLKTLENIF